MKWFARFLVMGLLLSWLAPHAHADFFGSSKPKHPRKKPKIKKKVESRYKIPIVGFDVVGNQNVSKEVILLSISSKVGDNFTESRLKKDVETIRNLGYFSSLETDLAPYQG